MKYKTKNNRDNQSNKNTYFEKINKIDKYILRVERDYKLVSGRGNTTTDLANTRKIIRE